MIYIFFENFLTKVWPEHRQSHLFWWYFVVGEHKFILLILHALYNFFAISRLECFEKNKNKTRTFVGLKSSKNKKFNLIKTLPVILVLLQVSKKSLRKLRTRSLLKIIRSSHRRCSEFTGKHLCQSLFFSKVAGLRQLY